MPLNIERARIFRIWSRNKILNKAVKHNLDKFPEDFMFALTRDEIMRISQIVTSSDIKYAKRVHAFTEQDVAMLSGVLNSPRAVKVNIEPQKRAYSP